MKTTLLCVLTVVVLAFSTLNFATAQTPTADILLNKTASSTMVLSGSTISYLYNVTNTGETPLTGGIYDDVYGFIGSFVDLQPSGWVAYNVTKVITDSTTNVATAYGVDSFGQNVTSSDTVFVEVYYRLPYIESCDSSGTKKDTFLLNDDVYATGSGYSASTTYDVYLVEDVTWVDGMAIPPRVPGTATTVTSDANGDIPATLLWSSPLVVGKYDIVVDVDGDGLYYAESDALDDNDIEVTAGFFVIPELPLGTILAALSMFVALVGYTGFKRHQTK